MSKVVRLSDNIIDLINDVKRIMKKDINNDFTLQFIDNMNDLDIIKHSLQVTKTMYLNK